MGNIVFLSVRSLAALDMYDIVIGNNPKEHGLKEVIIPAAYSIRSDFMEARNENSNDIVVAVASLEDDGIPNEEEEEEEEEE